MSRRRPEYYHTVCGGRIELSYTNKSRIIGKCQRCKEWIMSPDEATKLMDSQKIAESLETKAHEHPSQLSLFSEGIQA